MWCSTARAHFRLPLLLLVHVLFTCSAFISVVFFPLRCLLFSFLLLLPTPLLISCNLVSCWASVLAPMGWHKASRRRPQPQPQQTTCCCSLFVCLEPSSAVLTAASTNTVHFHILSDGNLVSSSSPPTFAWRESRHIKSKW